MDDRENPNGKAVAGIDDAVLHGALAERRTEPRVFAVYREEADDGSLNEQEHERRAHAMAQQCADCAPEIVRPSRLSPRQDMSASDAL